MSGGRERDWLTVLKALGSADIERGVSGATGAVVESDDDSTLRFDCGDGAAR